MILREKLGLHGAAAAKMPIAIGRSKPEPFLTSAGARLIVMRFAETGIEFLIAALRSRDSHRAIRQADRRSRELAFQMCFHRDDVGVDAQNRRAQDF
jgi:hypothetical protein